MPSRNALVVAVVVALLLPVLAGSAVGRPPPKDVCAVCGALENRDAVGDAPLVVEETRTVITVDRDGTGHWRTEVRLGRAAADELAGDPDRRRSLVAGAFERRAAVEDPRNLTSRLDGRTLVVEYDVPDVAHRGAGGVLVVDFFYWHGDSTRWHQVAADSLRVAGPDGTTPTRVPAGATVRDDGVEWTGDETSGRTLDRRTVLAFAADDGVVARAATVAAVQREYATASVADLPAAAALPTALLALVLALLAALGRRLHAFEHPQRLVVAAGVVGGATVVSLAAVAQQSAADPAGLAFDWLFAAAISGGLAVVPGTPVVLAVQWALAADWRPWHDGLPSRADVPRGDRAVRALLAGGAVAAATAGVAGSLLAAVAGGDPAAGIPTVLFVAPVALFLPLGAADRRRHPVRHLLRVGVVVAPVALALALGPFGGYAAALLPLLFAPWAALVGGVGVFAWPIGYALGGDDRDGGVGDSRDGGDGDDGDGRGSEPAVGVGTD